MPIRTLTIFGTRPEAIKMAPVLDELRRRPEIESILCVTGQHRDMLHQALEVLRLSPDFDLGIMRPNQSLSQITASTLLGLEPVFDAVRPDRVIVHGDTTTSFAAALAAFYARLPVGHVEAGLRTGDLEAPWPEEFNRRVVDSVTDLLWAPTRGAAEALEREGAAPDRILVTGNTVVDALLHARSALAADPALRSAIEGRLPPLDPGKRMILVTGHRRESFEGGLAEICQAIRDLLQRGDVQIVWPVHPNPVVLDTIHRLLPAHPDLFMIEPEDYHGFVFLMSRCHLIVSDSGGVQEEAPTLGKPVLVTRWVTERPEAVSCGAARLVGPHRTNIVAAVTALLDDEASYRAMADAGNPFGDGKAAGRIADSIIRRHERGDR